MSIGSKVKEEGVSVPLKLQKASIMRQLQSWVFKGSWGTIWVVVTQVCTYIIFHGVVHKIGPLYML